MSPPLSTSFFLIAISSFTSPRAFCDAIPFALVTSLYKICNDANGRSDIPLNVEDNPFTTASALVSPVTRFLCPINLSANSPDIFVICLSDSLISLASCVILKRRSFLIATSSFSSAVLAFFSISVV